MSIPSIFPTRVKKEHIKFIRHAEWDIYYSCMHQYPYLVVEHFHPQMLRQQQKIDRQSVEDPFRPDTKIAKHCQLTLPIYDNLKRYGLSPGHNAPAGTHRSTPSVWSDTFLFSNITPQEITFNAGVWVVLENWVKYLIRNPKLSRVRCITGSPPASPNSQRSRRVWDPDSQRMVTVRVPSQMFKIVLAQPRSINMSTFTPSKSEIVPVYVACFLYPNRPILPSPETWDLTKYRVMIPDIEQATGFKLSPLINRLFDLSKKGQPPASERLQSLETVASLEFNMAPGLLIQMERAKYYHRLAYAKTHAELDKVWAEFLKDKDRLQITELKHHEAYRDAAAAKLRDTARQRSKTSGRPHKPRSQTVKTKKHKKSKSNKTKKNPKKSLAK